MQREGDVEGNDASFDPTLLPIAAATAVIQLTFLADRQQPSRFTSLVLCEESAHLHLTLDNRKLKQSSQLPVPELVVHRAELRVSMLARMHRSTQALEAQHG